MFAAVRRLSNPGLASRPSCPPELQLSSVFDPKRSHVGRQHRKVEAKPRLVRAVARNAGSFEAAAEKLTLPTRPPPPPAEGGRIPDWPHTPRRARGSLLLLSRQTHRTLLLGVVGSVHAACNFSRGRLSPPWFPDPAAKHGGRPFPTASAGASPGHPHPLGPPLELVAHIIDRRQTQRTQLGVDALGRL